MSAAGQGFAADIAHRISLTYLGTAQQKFNNYQLRKIRVTHEKMSAALCVADEPKGNSYINTFHSSYVRMRRKVDALRGGMNGKQQMKREELYSSERQVALTIIEFEENQQYIFRSDSTQLFQHYAKQLHASSDYYKRATAHRSKVFQSLPKASPVMADADFVPAEPLNEVSNPTLPGEEFTLDRIKGEMPSVPEFLRVPGLPAGRLPEIKEVLPEVGSPGIPGAMPSDGRIPDAPGKIEKTGGGIFRVSFKSVRHKRFADRFSYQFQPQTMRFSGYLVPCISSAAHFQLYENWLVGMYWRQSAPFEIRYTPFMENYLGGFREAGDFGSGVGCSMQLLLNRSASVLIESGYSARKAPLWLDGLRPENWMMGFRLERGQGKRAPVVDILYNLRGGFTFRTGISIKNKFYRS